MTAVAIHACGMVSGVGLNAPASCAAIRGGVSGFEETRFMFDGDWTIGCEVPLVPPIWGRDKVLRMAAMAVGECLSAIDQLDPATVPLLLCVAETDRPGRIAGLDQSLLADLQTMLNVRLHPQSQIIAQGRVGGVLAIDQARQRLTQGTAERVIVAGADSYLTVATLESLYQRRRLLTAQNSNGFIPGEAAAAVILGPADQQTQRLCVRGIGYGREQATIESQEPLRGDGLAAALQAAVADAGCTFDDVDYRITDANGEQYAFKEAALAIARAIRKVKTEFDIWHPADCIGEVGAAAVPCCLTVATAAETKAYAPGPGVLAHFANDEGQRAALILGRQKPNKEAA